MNKVISAIFRVVGIKFDIRGAEFIPRTGGAVIVCNHISLVDFAFVGLLAARQGRLVRFMARSGAFAHPIFGPLMRAMQHIPVDRRAGFSALRVATGRLQLGELVGIFPEATISRAWTLKPFQPGAVALAVANQVSIIPIVTWGGHRLLTVDGHHSARRHIPVTIWVSEPIRPTDSWVAAQGKTRTQLIAAVTEDLHRRMQVTLDEAQRDYQAHPRNDRDRWWLPLHLGGTAPDPEQAATLDQQRMLD